MFSGLVATFDARQVQRIEAMKQNQSRRVVKVTKLSTLLDKHRLYDIDYCSIDTEGAELAILSDFDAARVRIGVLTIENNWDDDRIPKLMAGKGYEFVAKLEQDYIFRRRDVKPLPRTTVICAVWHGDEKRHELIRGHAENLARQTAAVDCIYVFDGGDEPPSWLNARAVMAKEKLT